MTTPPTTDERVTALAKVLGTMLFRLTLHFKSPNYDFASVEYLEDAVAQLNAAFPELGPDHD